MADKPFRIQEGPPSDRPEGSDRWDGSMTDQPPPG